MQLFSYKDLKEVPLKTIYNKYIIADISLVQFRGRVYEDVMTMEEALAKPLGSRFLKHSIYNKYIDELYVKLQKLNSTCVSRAHFIIKMGRGYAPELAILNKHPSVNKDKKIKEKKAHSSIKDLLKELKKQEIKEVKEISKKKIRPLNYKEVVYLENVQILNAGFGKIKNKNKKLINTTE